MNLALMKAKNEHFSNWWEPHATSTPLKATSNRVAVNKTQLLLLKTNSVNFPPKLNSALNTSNNLVNKLLEVTPPVTKRTKKKRATYFDLSSSSDEDLSDAKAPVIKLSSKKKRNKDLESENVILKNISTRKKLEESVNKKCDINISKNSPAENLKLKNKECQVNDENFKGQIKSRICCRNTGTDRSKENVVVMKSKKRKYLTKDAKLLSDNEENSENIAEHYDNFKCRNDFNKTERKPLPKKAEENQKKIVKTLTEKLNQDIPDLKTIVEKAHNVKLSQCQKKRSRKMHNNSSSVNEISRKEKSKNFKGTNKLMVSTEGFYTSQNKSNLSHQLFSETVEQEFINILDLTKDEANDASEITKCSLQKGKECQSFIWPYNLSHKICIDSKNKKEEPEIKEKTLENQNNKLSPVNNQPKKTQYQKITRSGKFLSQTDDVNQQVINISSERHKEESTKNKCKKKNLKLSKQKNPNTVKSSVKDNINDGFDNAKSDNRKGSSDVLNYFDPSRDINSDTHSTNLDKKNSVTCAGITNSSKNSVFKQLDKLSFTKNESGCSVLGCWKINNFKCGVFKLEVKAQLSCRTLHSNSHLGGVLLKGNLKIIIGIEEKDLKEGDMAFVPPLTEWQATNNGESESVFYYWCGNF